MQLLFLDESGDHSLAAINPEYPVFVLGGVLVDADYADRALEEEVAQFKLGTLGRPDIVLHTTDIVRRRNGFEALKVADFRERFYGSLNDLMSRLEYRVIACAIRKPDLSSGTALRATGRILFPHPQARRRCGRGLRCGRVG